MGQNAGGGGGGRGGPGQLFHGGPGHPHGINSRTIGGFAQDIGALWGKTTPTPPYPPLVGIRAYEALTLNRRV